MTNSLKACYGAGWRAGMARPAVELSGQVDKYGTPTKHLVRPKCPVKGFFKRVAWHMGLENGERRRIMGGL